MRKPLTPQAKRYHRLRASLMARGLSLSRWARVNGYPPTTVYSAASGQRRSPLSRQILAELESIDT